MTSPSPEPGPGVAARYGRVMEPAMQRLLRRVFHQMNKGMVLLWRVGLGRFADIWPRGFGKLLVIEHKGRRSGARYLTPVNFTSVNGAVYCIAAFGEDADWYRNLLAAPENAAWLPDGRWGVIAEDASDDPRRLELMRAVLVDSGFAAPLFGLHPHRMSESELAAATETYRLVRLRPLQRRATADGPGDLAWIWIPLGVVCGLRWLGRRRRSR